MRTFHRYFMLLCGFGFMACFFFPSLRGATEETRDIFTVTFMMFVYYEVLTIRDRLEK